jgi:hypothetical protein
MIIKHNLSLSLLTSVFPSDILSVTLLYDIFPEFAITEKSMSENATDRTLKDSGTRQEFSTGARRDVQAGKGRFDLISPLALYHLARVYEEGAKKYGDRNFEKGMPLSRMIDSARRHINNHMEGKRDEPHIVQAAWNLLAYIHIAEMVQRGLLPEELNDMPNYVSKEKVSPL